MGFTTYLTRVYQEHFLGARAATLWASAEACRESLGMKLSAARI